MEERIKPVFVCTKCFVSMLYLYIGVFDLFQCYGIRLFLGHVLDVLLRNGITCLSFSVHLSLDKFNAFCQHVFFSKTSIVASGKCLGSTCLSCPVTVWFLNA